MAKQRKNNKRVQITLSLSEDDMELYNMVREKNGFFSAMINMAYKNQIYKDMFFNAPKKTIQDVQLDITEKEVKEQKLAQKKKTSASSW